MSKRQPMLAMVVGVLLVAACGASTGSTAPSVAVPSVPAAAPSPSGPADALHLVVIGDSIPFGDHFCPGCTAFPDLYAKDLETRLGRPVALANRSRDDSATMDMIELQLKGEEMLRGQVGAADVVLLSVGFNNAMPDTGTWSGCTGNMGGSIQEYVAWALATTPACIKEGLDTYATQYDRIFSAITDLRAGKPTVYAVINVHDGNLNGSDFTDAGLPADKLAKVNAWMIGIYDQWNAMECAKGKEHGFACVDVYHAFNGPKGDKPSGLVNTIDGAHPSQAGNDLIASLLAKLDTSAIAR